MKTSEQSLSTNNNQSTKGGVMKENEKERMIEHIKGSVKGLQALQKTYENDITMKARIDCLIDDVNKILTQ